MNVIRICRLCRGQFDASPFADPVCDKCRADAKLGRMVRFNAKRFGITKKDHSFQHQNGRSWIWWSTIEAALQDAGFDTPEEALAAAGVKGDKND